MDHRYILASGSQVREEDFGLLFFTVAGPRLYFVSCGKLLGCDFFQGNFTLSQWLMQHSNGKSITEALILELKKSLHRLEEKGVIDGF